MKEEITIKMWLFILSLAVSFFLGSFGQYKNQARYVQMIDKQFKTMKEMQNVNDRCVKQVSECISKIVEVKDVNGKGD